MEMKSNVFGQEPQQTTGAPATTTAPTTTAVTYDNDGNVVGQNFTKEFPNVADALIVQEVMTQLGLSSKFQLSVANNKAIVTLVDVTPRDLDVLQRKINIRTWSKKATEVADKVTNFATDVADYALNGGLAPAAVAISNAALTTTRVVATAGLAAGAGIATTVLRNGRIAATQISNSPEVTECSKELKKCWSAVSGKLFGTSGDSSSSWTAC